LCGEDLRPGWVSEGVIFNTLVCSGSGKMRTPTASYLMAVGKEKYLVGHCDLHALHTSHSIITALLLMGYDHYVYEIAH